MMRTLLMMFFYFPLLTIAQGNRTDVQDPEYLAIKNFKLKAQKSAPSELVLPFSAIRIIDGRFDTTKMGFVWNVGLFKDKTNFFIKTSFKGGVSKALEDYYNDYYEGSFSKNEFELLIVLKRFWASTTNNKKSKRIELTTKIGRENYVYFNWEYYIGKNGAYMPIKRIDTIMEDNEMAREEMRDKPEERRLKLLKYFMKVMIEQNDFSNAVAKFDQHKKMTVEEIYAYNEKRNKIPVLEAKAFTKGVYMSFDEFVRNEPSITEFKVKKTRYGTFNTENYIQDSKGELISGYWGYSDGNEFRYGALGNEKIYRIGNTFQFFNKSRNVMYAEGDSEPTAYKEVWIPYQIDMETGLIY